MPTQNDPVQSQLRPTSKQIPTWREYLILLVDDDLQVLRQLRRVLEIEGEFNVITANSAEEGLDLIKNQPIKLVISDQKMEPGMGGVEFLAKVKEINPDILTAILSAYSEPELILKSVNDSGAFQYMVKPWNDDELIMKVDQCLQYYQAQSQIRKMAKANQELVARLATQEKFSLMGGLSTTLYTRFFHALRYAYKCSQKRLSKLKSGSDEETREQFARESLCGMSMALSQFRLMAEVYNQKPYFEQADLNCVISDCIEEGVEKAKLQANIEIKVEQDISELPNLWIDRELFVCALRSVFENAVRFNKPENPRIVSITAKCIKQPRWLVQLQIRDHGKGVSLPMAEKVFEPLHGASSPPSFEHLQPNALGAYNFTPYNHVGLGLTVARWCLARHEGTLELLNPGEAGAIFQIELPMVLSKVADQVGV